MCTTNNGVDYQRERAIGGLVQLATTGLASELEYHFSVVKSEWHGQQAKKYSRTCIREKIENFLSLSYALGYSKTVTRINASQAVKLALIKAAI